MISTRCAGLAVAALITLAGSAQAQLIGPSTKVEPYVLPSRNGVITQSLLTVGESVNGYRLVGIPDGMGALDLGDGTFSLLVNHELGADAGIARAHGQTGAFVSQWTINAKTGEVLAGRDLIRDAYWFDAPNGQYELGGERTKLARLCSADLPLVGAFYNSNSGLGTEQRIFMNGEEAGAEGRAWAHIVTGDGERSSWELPHLGKFSWENSVAHYNTGDLTLVAGLDDSGGGEVYFYAGAKRSEGNDIERAGLFGGDLWGLRVDGLPNEGIEDGLEGQPSRRFDLHRFGDVSNTSGAQLEIDSTDAGVTSFARPEDGHWNPSNPNQFVFTTTGANGAPARLWLAEFDDVNNPASGGEISMLLDGSEGGVSFDNLTIDRFGNVLIQEDPGGSDLLARIWNYNINTGRFTELAAHNPKFFSEGGDEFLTLNEESSGIIDAWDILGPGWFMINVQAHYDIGDPELVEGGQLLAFFSPLSVPAPSAAALLAAGLLAAGRRRR